MINSSLLKQNNWSGTLLLTVNSLKIVIKCFSYITVIFSVQLSCVQLFVTPWTAACRSSLSNSNSQSLPNSCPLSWWCYPIISSQLTDLNQWYDLVVFLHRRWDGWMPAQTQWTWVWASSGRWWRTGKPGMLQSTGSQRVRHDWEIELNWTEMGLSRETLHAQVTKSWTWLSNWTT